MTRKLTASFVLSLSLTALSAQALAFDVAFDAARVFVRMVTDDLHDSGPVLVPANNSASRPIILPCNLARYGVQVDARYLTGVGALYPQLQSRYYVVPNTLVWSNGYEFLAGAPFSVNRSNVSPFNVGQTAVIGQMSIDEVDVAARNWLFQPDDLPPNVTVRHALHISLYTDVTYSPAAEATDDVPMNNNRFLYVRRVCPL